MQANISVGGCVEPEELTHLYRSVGWQDHADIERATAVISRSDVIVQARIGVTLVGFCRALTDGILYANIYDMIVAPEFQHQGIGSAMLRTLLRELHGVRKISLNTSTGAQEFYEKHGFEPGTHYYQLYQW